MNKAAPKTNLKVHVVGNMVEDNELLPTDESNIPVFKNANERTALKIFFCTSLLLSIILSTSIALTLNLKSPFSSLLAMSST
mmetsp:Transcript_9024/g.11313  ORF Transcript_9024/g.11313 Transcript_9024/m.11313 type:complete len:82 (+) Transcript_9024:167-412(+)